MFDGKLNQITKCALDVQMDNMDNSTQRYSNTSIPFEIIIYLLCNKLRARPLPSVFYTFKITFAFFSIIFYSFQGSMNISIMLQATARIFLTLKCQQREMFPLLWVRHHI